MYIKVGYELIYDCPQPTPMLLMLNIHYSHAYHIVKPDQLVTNPVVLATPCRDAFGNWCNRIEAPAGRTRISTSAIVRSTGIADPVEPAARQLPISELPEETLVYLLGSRYCETDLLMGIAWQQFGNTPLGRNRVQAICDFVHHHIRSTTHRHGRRGLCSGPTTNESAFVGTLHIWRLHSAGA